MKIGIDFGTTNSKIGFYDEQGNLSLFGFPTPNDKLIRTAVTYIDGDNFNTSSLRIGAPALGSFLNQRKGIRFAENFKMFLPLKDMAAWHDAGWRSDKSPLEVTRDYLRELLLDQFSSQYGPISSMVVSVPEVWQRQSGNLGAERLRNIIKDELALPLDHLRSEPVCAAAFYAHRYQHLEGQAHRGKRFVGNLLVCDMGGGTFDVALCHIDGDHIEVLDFNGSGEEGFGQAGVAFDQNIVRNAYRAAHRPTIPDERTLLRLLREFEQVKIDEHGAVAQFFAEEKHLKPEYLGQPLYTFHDGEYQVTFAEAREAFAVVDDEIKRVLDMVLGPVGGRRVQVDRVAVVGGFGRSPFVQEAILSHVGVESRGKVQFDARLNDEQMAFAVARGATLIANEKVSAVEYYPHTIGIQAHYLDGGDLKKAFIRIIEARSVQQSGVPHFLPKQVEVIGHHRGELPVSIELHGDGRPLTFHTDEVTYPPPGLYFVGVVVDRSNLAMLVFRPVAGGKDREYPLTDLKILMREQ